MTPTVLVRTVASYLRPYIEIHGVTGDFYYFRKESTSLRDADNRERLWHPRVRHTMLRSFHSHIEGILYSACPKSALLDELRSEDLLYIGCSANGGARFWRGRPSPTGKFPESRSCFHHEQMRRGRNGSNLENYLVECGSVVVYTLTDASVLTIATEHKIALPQGRYPAHQLERAILAEGFSNWKWNARA